MLSKTTSIFLNFLESISLFLYRFPRPVTVEPMDQYDDEEGLPEKLVIKNQQYHKYVPVMLQRRRVWASASVLEGWLISAHQVLLFFHKDDLTLEGEFHLLFSCHDWLKDF